MSGDHTGPIETGCRASGLPPLVAIAVPRRTYTAKPLARPLAVGRRRICRPPKGHLPFSCRQPPPEGRFERFRACPAASHWVTWGHRHPRGSGGTPYSACCRRGHEPRTRFSSTRDRLDLCPACHYPVVTRGPMEPACCRPFGAPGLSTEVPRLTGKEPAAPKLFASWLALLSWPTTRNSSALVADDPPDRTTTRGFIMPGETMAPTAPRF